MIYSFCFFLDIDECVIGFYGCYGNVSCNNIEGFYICICKLGFYGDGRNSCMGN